MGFADRDYNRVDLSQGKGGRGGAYPAAPRLTRWSVTTWLIVLCCAVFVVDRLLGARQLSLAWTGQSSIIDPDLAQRESLIPKDSIVQLEPTRHVDTTGRPSGIVEIQRAYVDPNGRVHPYRADYYRLTLPIQRWLEFSTARALVYPSTTWGLVGFEFWRFFGYQFLHADVMHLALNMFGLYIFGPIVEEYLRGKRYLAFYLLCGLFGAVLYMLLNAGGIAMHSLFPGARVPPFLPDSPFTPLIGASASIYGVILAAAYLAPNDVVLVLYVLPMRLRTLAYVLIAIAVGSIVFRGSNAGGEAAHLGGAIAGAWFIRHTAQLHGFFDFLGRADPWSRSAKERRARKASRPIAAAEVDRILAKIKDKGMGSLTNAERRALKDSARS